MPLPPEVAEQLPEDIRSDSSLESINDLGGLARSYVETKKLVGGSIRIPDEKASPEDSQKWWGETSKRLAERGFMETPPESADKYEFSFENVDPEVVKNDPVLKEFKGIAHGLGLSSKKANELAGQFLHRIAPMMMAQEYTDEEVKANLQKAFGAQTDEEVSRARMGLKRARFTIPELNDTLEDATITVDNKQMKFGNYPPFVKLFGLVDRLMSNDSAGHIGGGGGGFDSLESLDSQIAELRSNTALPQDEIGKRLETLYKKKAALGKR